MSFLHDLDLKLWCKCVFFRVQTGCGTPEGSHDPDHSSFFLLLCSSSTRQLKISQYDVTDNSWMMPWYFTSTWTVKADLVLMLRKGMRMLYQNGFRNRCACLKARKLNPTTSGFDLWCPGWSLWCTVNSLQRMFILTVLAVPGCEAYPVGWDLGEWGAYPCDFSQLPWKYLEE